MAKDKFQTPALQEYSLIPKLQQDASIHIAPFKSKEEFQAPLGYPSELADDWKEKAIDKMGELLGKYRSLRVYLDSCIQCGACTDKCHYYLGTKDPNNMPVGRQNLFRNVYRRYFTLPGKFFPKLVGATDLTKEVLDEWYTYYHQCSQCRRCAVFCPIGIDTAEISMAAREVMDSIGVGQKYCNEIIAKVHKIGNNLGLPEPALEDTLEGLEEDVKEETAIDVKYPVDVKDSEVLLITPSADFFAEPHVDGLIGYGKVLHQAGISWTLSSHASEAANFGMFIGSYKNMKKLALRIREAALDLNVKRIVFGECGHAWRVAYSFLNTLAGPFDFLDSKYPVPQHICEVTHDLIQKNVLKFDKSANDNMTLTYHDSCNVARASNMGGIIGGQFSIPRDIIKSSVNNFYDMEDESIREKTYCCGGGGGLLTDDLIELRVKGALPRMEALKRVIDEYNVTHMAAICAICKSQFSKVFQYYGLELDKIVSLHQLVGNALIMNKKEV